MIQRYILKKGKYKSSVSLRILIPFEKEKCYLWTLQKAFGSWTAFPFVGEKCKNSFLQVNIKWYLSKSISGEIKTLKNYQKLCENKIKKHAVFFPVFITWFLNGVAVDFGRPELLSWTYPKENLLLLLLTPEWMKGDFTGLGGITMHSRKRLNRTSAVVCEWFFFFFFKRRESWILDLKVL